MPPPLTPLPAAYNVKDYGAVGNGCTNDSAAIAAAVIAASTGSA